MVFLKKNDKTYVAILIKTMHTYTKVCTHIPYTIMQRENSGKKY